MFILASIELRDSNTLLNSVISSSSVETEFFHLHWQNSRGLKDCLLFSLHFSDALHDLVLVELLELIGCWLTFDKKWFFLLYYKVR